MPEWFRLWIGSMAGLWTFVSPAFAAYWIYRWIAGSNTRRSKGRRNN